jgi:GNAT superfamily N-acetyltransferase
MSKTEMLELAKKQLGLDLACSPGLFDSYENSIQVSKLLDGRRLFSKERDFFKMATFGCGTVISADEKILEWCNEYLKNYEGIRLFELNATFKIENEIRKYEKHLSGIGEFYLPFQGICRKKVLFPTTAVQWFEKDEIPELYADKRFKNALLYDAGGLRPDILVVAALIDGQYAAMAGASMDSELFWQIGIDVMPEYRKKGLAAYLVSELTDEIIKRDAIPYYGTWSANIASRSVAAASGYFPAWVETYAKDLQDL